MANPKPISIEYVAPAEYSGPAPQPFLVVGEPAEGAVAWADISDKPTTFAPTIGTTAITAKAGNYVPTSTEVSTALKAKTQINALATVTAANGTVAAGDPPTKAEFDALVTLANANKAAINAIIAALKA